MAKQVHIYIYGDIGEKGITLDYVKGMLIANPNAEEAIVRIRSRGGDVDEGFAIYDALIASGLKITTVIEGICASIATVVALAGSVRIISPNSEFMIHNAWVDPLLMDSGNAVDYQEMADYIKRADQRILDFYTRVVGKANDLIKPMMDAETYMSAPEALKLGFVTEIQESLKAVAYLKKPETKAKVLPNKNKMSLKSIMADAKKVLLALAGVQASESTLTDGSLVYYAEDALTEGVNVFTDPEMTMPVADGDITLQDGTIITVSSGAVSAIVDTDSVDNADMEALQAQVDALTAENLELKTLNDEAEVVITNMSTKLTGLANTRSTAKVKTSANNSQKFRTQAAETSSKKFSMPKKEGGK